MYHFGGGYHLQRWGELCMCAGDIWEIPVPSAQRYCEPKVSLKKEKKKFYLKKRRKEMSY